MTKDALEAPLSASVDRIEELFELLKRNQPKNWKPVLKVSLPRKENAGWENVRKANRERTAEKARREFREMYPKSLSPVDEFEGRIRRESN